VKRSVSFSADSDSNFQKRKMLRQHRSSAPVLPSTTPFKKAKAMKGSREMQTRFPGGIPITMSTRSDAEPLFPIDGRERYLRKQLQTENQKLAFQLEQETFMSLESKKTCDVLRSEVSVLQKQNAQYEKRINELEILAMRANARKEKVIDLLQSLQSGDESHISFKHALQTVIKEKNELLMKHQVVEKKLQESAKTIKSLRRRLDDALCSSSPSSAIAADPIHLEDESSSSLDKPDALLRKAFDKLDLENLFTIDDEEGKPQLTRKQARASAQLALFGLKFTEACEEFQSSPSVLENIQKAVARISLGSRHLTFWIVDDENGEIFTECHRNGSRVAFPISNKSFAASVAKSGKANVLNAVTLKECAPYDAQIDHLGSVRENSDASFLKESLATIPIVQGHRTTAVLQISKVASRSVSGTHRVFSDGEIFCLSLLGSVAKQFFDLTSTNSDS